MVLAGTPVRATTSDSDIAPSLTGGTALSWGTATSLRLTPGAGHRHGAHPAPLVVLEGLSQLRFGSHDEWAVGGDRFADGPAAQHEHLQRRGVSVLGGG